MRDMLGGLLRKSGFLYILPLLFITERSGAQNRLKASMERGKKVYETTCLPCHQADGGGVPRLNPPLIGTQWVTGDKKTLVNVILKGMNKEIEVNDEYFDNVMPAQPALSDEQIADVLTYVRNSFGNKESAVTAAEVKKWRSAK